MFSITSDFSEPPKAKGFHMTFANGFTASVQWGLSNYADCLPNGDARTAEVAAWNTPNSWFHAPGFDYRGDDVLGNLTADEVFKFLGEVANAR